MLIIATDYPLDRLVVGGISSVAGFVVILCRKSIKEWSDERNSKDWPIGSLNLGWFTKERLTNTSIILLGLMLLGGGAGFIISAFRG